MDDFAWARVLKFLNAADEQEREKGKILGRWSGRDDASALRKILGFFAGFSRIWAEPMRNLRPILRVRLDICPWGLKQICSGNMRMSDCPMILKSFHTAVTQLVEGWYDATWKVTNSKVFYNCPGNFFIGCGSCLVFYKAFDFLSINADLPPWCALFIKTNIMARAI